MLLSESLNSFTRKIYSTISAIMVTIDDIIRHMIISCRYVSLKRNCSDVSAHSVIDMIRSVVLKRFLGEWRRGVLKTPNAATYKINDEWPQNALACNLLLHNILGSWRAAPLFHLQRTPAQQIQLMGM